MPAPDILVPHAALHTFATSLFAARGMSHADAATVADVLVWADRRGVGSHGVQRIPMYLDLIERGDMVPTARPQITRTLPSAIVIDANRAAGPIAMTFALEHASKAARATCVCYAVASATTHTGAIGYYSARAAEAGFAAIVTSSGPPNMAYYGAKSASASTSPLSIAVPGADAPLVLDMATAVIGMGRLAQARERGQPIPAGSALDESGEPTTDPASAAIPLSLGGPKGSGMSVLFECLSSVMAGAPLLAASLTPGVKRRHIHNGMIILIDVSQLTDLAAYKRDIADLAAALKRQPRKEAASEIMLPGERGKRAFSKSESAGVAVTASTWARLAKVAAAFSVDMPLPAT